MGSKIADAGYAADNMVFGSGGALSQTKEKLPKKVALLCKGSRSQQGCRMQISISRVVEKVACQEALDSFTILQMVVSSQLRAGKVIRTRTFLSKSLKMVFS